MTTTGKLDANLIREFSRTSQRDRIAHIKVFAEIDSTHSYLIQMPPPAPGKSNIAVTTNQTAGRGRLGKAWVAPPDSGLALSVAYTFGSNPENLPALTLSLGLAAIAALHELGASGVELKWPNDLVALDGKLGGILTEVQQQSADSVTVVTGIGINVDLPGELDFGLDTDWARRVVDIRSITQSVPDFDQLTGTLVAHLLDAFAEFEADGFSAAASRWRQYDWLLSRDITVDTGAEQISGIGAGIADDGALLIDTAQSGIRRITAGTIVIAGRRSVTE